MPAAAYIQESGLIVNLFWVGKKVSLPCCLTTFNYEYCHVLYPPIHIEFRKRFSFCDRCSCTLVVDSRGISGRGASSATGFPDQNSGHTSWYSMSELVSSPSTTPLRATAFTSQEDALLGACVYTPYTWSTWARVWRNVLAPHQVFEHRSAAQLRKRASHLQCRARARRRTLAADFAMVVMDEDHGGSTTHDPDAPDAPDAFEEDPACGGFDDDYDATAFNVRAIVVGSEVVESDEEDETTCPICCSTVHDASFTVLGHCAHGFCSACLGKWVAKAETAAAARGLSRPAHGFVNATCPTCRGPIKCADLQAESFASLMVPARMELWFTEMSALGSGLVAIPRYVPGVVGQSLTFSKLFTKMGDFRAAIIKFPLHMLLSPLLNCMLETVHPDGARSFGFNQYVDKLVAGDPLGLRIMELCALNALGHHSLELASTASETDPLHRQLQEEECYFLTTMPLWLGANGEEVITPMIAHETMCKPEDLHEVEKPVKEAIHAFFSAAEIKTVGDAEDGDAWDDVDERSDQGREDYSSGQFVRVLQHVPIWSQLVKALYCIIHPINRARARAHADEQRVQAALFYASIITANATNEDAAAAWGASPEAASAWKGRLMNYHAYKWLKETADRALTTRVGMGVTDSIPISLQRLNFDAMHKAGGSCAAATLYYIFAPLNRALFRHVRHPITRIFIDSCGDAKLCAAAYELGALNSIHRADLQSYLSGVQRLKYVTHPITKLKVLVVGCGRTNGSFLRQGGKFPSDTHLRLHSVAWCGLTWDGAVAVGAFDIPGAPGGSAQGKAAIPNDTSERVVREQRILRAVDLLRRGSTSEELSAQELVRPIFPEWCHVQRSQASDFVALTNLCYKYSVPTGYLGRGKVMLYHVCGDVTPPANLRHHHDVLSRMPGMRAVRDGRFWEEVPHGLWKKGAAKPVLARNGLEADHVRTWWKGARLDAHTWEMNGTDRRKWTSEDWKRHDF